MKKNPFSFKTLTYLSVFLGIAFRLFHYFYNHSLWMDEVYLSTSLVKMNYGELATQLLDYQQKAPIGFLWTVKWFLHLLGNKEMALRLFSLLGGIVSLFIFIPVARYFLRPAGVFIATAILALASPLIFHSTEAKQYQTELLGTLICLYMYIKYNDKQDIKSALIWSIGGAAIIWFSYSSIFILAGMAGALSVYYLLKKNIRAFTVCLIPFSIWMFSFLLNYFLFTHKHAESEWIVYWFKAYNNFMPLPPQSINDFKWFFVNLYRALDYPLGLFWNFVATDTAALAPVYKMPFLPILFLLPGIYVFVTLHKKHALVWLFAFGGMFLASGLKLYPLTERFWVFISPLIILMIAAGYAWVYDRFTNSMVRMIVSLVLIAGPLVQSVLYVVHPEEFLLHKRSFQREALFYINQHFQPGDAVYVYWNNLPGYRLYKKMYSLPFIAIEGKDVRKISGDYTSYYHNLQPDIDNLKNKKRVWLIVNNYYLTDIGDKIDDPAWYYKKPGTPVSRLKQYFSSLGTISDEYTSFDVCVCLLEIR